MKKSIISIMTVFIFNTLECFTQELILLEKNLNELNKSFEGLKSRITDFLLNIAQENPKSSGRKNKIANVYKAEIEQLKGTREQFDAEGKHALEEIATKSTSIKSQKQFKEELGILLLDYAVSSYTEPRELYFKTVIQTLIDKYKTIYPNDATIFQAQFNDIKLLRKKFAPELKAAFIFNDVYKNSYLYDPKNRAVFNEKVGDLIRAFTMALARTKLPNIAIKQPWRDFLEQFQLSISQSKSTLAGEGLEQAFQKVFSDKFAKVMERVQEETKEDEASAAEWE